MPVIGAKVSVTIKDEFSAVASARSTTTSALAARLIVDFLDRQSKEDAALTYQPFALPSTPSVVRQGTRSEQVFVRLEPYYFAELGRLAMERVWHRGTYLGNLLRAHIDQRPVLCELEISAVRQVARQLADLGRNVNQIAKKLHSSPDYAYLVSSFDFDLLRLLVELESNAVKELVKANLRGWGVSDAKA